MEKTLKDLFIDEIKDLYSAEKQISKALPQIVKKTTSNDLKEAFEKHINETENQIARLEEVFQEIDIIPSEKKCKGIEGIIEEGNGLMGDFDKSYTLDAALIALSQKIEHYEIAAYGTLRTYAEQLNMTIVADLLQETLIEEYSTNEKLNELAMNQINLEAG